jgi:hypothetical protein
MLIGAACMSLHILKGRRPEPWLKSQYRLNQIPILNRTSGGRLPTLANPTGNPTRQAVLGVFGVRIDEEVNLLSSVS